MIKRAGHLTDEGNVLLDAGEGCAGAMKRYLGHDEAQRAIRDLKVLWVSHQHPDHMLGVRGVLALRRPQTPGSGLNPGEVLTIVGPRSLKEWLEESPNPPGLARPWRFVHSASVYAEGFGGGPFRTPQSFPQRPPPPPPPPMPPPHPGSGANGYFLPRVADDTPAKKLARHAGLSRFEALPVRHCPEAAAVVLGGGAPVSHGGRGAWQIAYSGDCRPSVELARLARGVDVLIHEATFDDSLADHALRKRHSTTGEALRMASQCGERTQAVLTHFSQRYPRGVGVESVDGEGGGTGLPPVTAFDGMRCRLDEVGVVRECMGGVNEMFARYERARDETMDEDDVAGAVTLEPEAEEAAEEEVR